MKKKLIFIAIVAAISTVGVMMSQKAELAGNSSLSLANVEALTDIEDDEPATTPSPWDLSPNRMITSTVKEYKLTCTSEEEIKVPGITISGTFQRGTTYSIIVETVNCNESVAGSWCDQRRVGSRVISIGPTQPDTPQP